MMNFSTPSIQHINLLNGLIALFFLYSCEKEEDFSCIVDNNSSVEKTIQLDYFDRIGVYVEGNIEIKQGEKTAITLKGNSALVDSLYTTIENNKLNVELRSPYCTPSTQLQLTITTPIVKEFLVSEKSQVVFNDFDNQQKLKLQINSNSVIEINQFEGLNEMAISLQEGAHFISNHKIKEVSKLKIDIKGNGSLSGYPIVAQDVEIDIEGKGNCEITALSRLDVNIVGNANVYCNGKPKIHNRITGKGDVYFTD
jgi:hypothetical protein